MIPNGQPIREIEQHHDLALDFIPINFLGHLAGPISIVLELKSGVRPLFIGLDSSEGEICRNNNSIKPPVVYQTQELPHLLHPIGTRPLRPLEVTHWNLIDVARHIWLDLPNIEPL